MESTANFKVDTKLAALLGENYRSSEQAIKELVDNSWDADADNVWVQLPAPMTSQSIVVRDDGSGMTEKEIKSEYLVVANDRTTRKGERTTLKNRLVKGRKGIGKFSGLMTANVMQLATSARGQRTTLFITKDEILRSRRDLEKVDLPVTVDECPANEKGTTITLSSLNQNFSFPNPDRLKQFLVLDYGHEKDFKVFVNGEQIGIEDIPGKTFTEEAVLPNVGRVKLTFTVSDTKRPLKQSGIAIRVNGKVVGKPDYFGINESSDIPPKLAKKVYGEIEADGLSADVTADWGAVIENSNAFKQVQEFVKPRLEESIKAEYYSEVNLMKARLQKDVNRKIETLPEYKRKFAQIAFERVLGKFYGESEEKISTVVSVVLDAFERNDYWVVLKNIEDADHSDISIFADALSEFGIVDIALIAQQAQSRLRFLDELDKLVSNSNTLEQSVHKTLEKNLWVFGSEYSLMSSNKTLSSIIADLINTKYRIADSRKRPDLFLAQDVSRRHLLIEFKRPSETITRAHESQALQYRDHLNAVLHNKLIHIMVIGGRVDKTISSQNERADVELLSYKDVLSNARTNLDWLINELTTR